MHVGVILHELLCVLLCHLHPLLLIIGMVDYEK